MTSTELVAEYLAAMRRMTLADARSSPWPIAAVAAVCPAPCRIVLSPRGTRYRPARPGEAGRPAYVMPACCVDPRAPSLVETDAPEAVIAAGPVIDLVAVSPAAPGRWARRTGAAVVLGAAAPQYMTPDPVPVHRAPVGWLRSGCRGIVILTGDRAEAAAILRGLGAIEAEDAAHAAELREIMARPYPIPPVTIAPREVRHAA